MKFKQMTAGFAAYVWAAADGKYDFYDIHAWARGLTIVEFQGMNKFVEDEDWDEVVFFMGQSCEEISVK